MIRDAEEVGLRAAWNAQFIYYLLSYLPLQRRLNTSTSHIMILSDHDYAARVYHKRTSKFGETTSRSVPPRSGMNFQTK